MRVGTRVLWMTSAAHLTPLITPLVASLVAPLVHAPPAAIRRCVARACSEGGCSGNGSRAAGKQWPPSPPPGEPPAPPASSAASHAASRAAASRATAARSPQPTASSQQPTASSQQPTQNTRHGCSWRACNRAREAGRVACGPTSGETRGEGAEPARGRCGGAGTCLGELVVEEQRARAPSSVRHWRREGANGANSSERGSRGRLECERRAARQPRRCAIACPTRAVRACQTSEALESTWKISSLSSVEGRVGRRSEQLCRGSLCPCRVKDSLTPSNATA